MFKRTVIAAAIAASPFAAQAAQSVEDLQTQIDILAQEVESLKEDQGASSNPFGKVSLGGYGEIHYNHYNRDPEFGGKQENDQIDAHRFVLFVGYDFTDKVRFFSEVELDTACPVMANPVKWSLNRPISKSIPLPIPS